MSQILNQPSTDHPMEGSATGNRPVSRETNPIPEAAPDQALTLIEMLTQLARRRRTIAKVTTAAILAGAVLGLLLPVRYSATTEILPPRQTQSAADLFLGQIASPNLGSLASLAGGGLGLQSPNDLYVGLLKSRPIADAILRQFDLENLYHARDRSAARQELADNTTIVSEKSGLIRISVTDKSKERSAAMANAYTQQLRLLTQTLAVTEASQRRLFYEEQLIRAKDDLVNAEATFQLVQQKKGLVQPDAQARALIGNIAGLRAQVAAKEVEVQALRSYSTERNPDVQLAESQLSSLRAQVSRLQQPSLSSGPSDSSIQNVPAAGLEYLSSEHELLYRQTLYDLLIRQYDAARLDESREATIIQVVEPAIPPDRKSSPKRLLIVELAALFGFFAAVLYVLAAMTVTRARNNPRIDDQFMALSAALRLRRSKPATVAASPAHSK